MVICFCYPLSSNGPFDCSFSAKSLSFDQSCSSSMWKRIYVSDVRPGISSSWATHWYSVFRSSGIAISLLLSLFLEGTVWHYRLETCNSFLSLICAVVFPCELVGILVLPWYQDLCYLFFKEFSIYFKKSTCLSIVKGSCHSNKISVIFSRRNVMRWNLYLFKKNTLAYLG